MEKKQINDLNEKVDELERLIRILADNQSVIVKEVANVMKAINEVNGHTETTHSNQKAIYKNVKSILKKIG